MSNVYVLTINNDWDLDYKRVFTKLDSLVKAIVEDFEEECVFLDKEDIKKHIKEREKAGRTYLFFADEIDNSINPESYCGSYSVMKCILE